MTRRTLAIVISAPLMVVLWLTAAIAPAPYVQFSPGMTVDVLSEVQGQERIQVSGHETYYDGGELRMTTVGVTRPEDSISLLTAISAWLSDERAVVPYDTYYQDGITDEENDAETAVQMVSSQDAAIAAALIEMGYELETTTVVLFVTEGMPADGKIGVRDHIVSVNGKPVAEDGSVIVDEVQGSDGKPVVFEVLREGKEVTVEVTPKDVDGTPMIGIQTGPSFKFPFQVSINIDPRIGGPSAGLMFALGIYDTLTKGSLTGGKQLAGTGTISPDGKVGPIGGIQQKIPAARDAGAELFLVPPDNCKEALGGANGDMVLVRADTLSSAVDAIEAWVADPSAELPSCEGVG
ncbi:PDZ domain-containing protein [Nocardioides sp. AE5]|uniref:YlbL family protein n=1 Tax=Nocardioides sp. AE5 TaxID=2962573 RepID=UPI002882BE84|nr:PDZ domain-containing protein [Nocardioides sp. AE5]MDT0203876.1 PDZ domain-containing protein [Nocardioides sp. AE5]